MPSLNPKVSAYVPEKLAKQLEQFRAKQGLKSTSTALIRILEDYFNADTDKGKLEALEGK